MLKQQLLDLDPEPMSDVILREYFRRRAAPKVDVYRHLFKEQLQVVHDSATLVAVLCSRRSGKSEAAGARAVHAALQFPGSIVPYIALTRFSAKTIVWPILVKLNKLYELGAEMLEASLTMRLRNGSTIVLIGADTAGFIERLRGGKYPVAIVDEGQSFREHLGALIDDILLPAVADYNGQIYMLGTPGVRQFGVFYDATYKKTGGWNLHSWTVLQNPHMPNIRGFLAKLLERKGWTEKHPTFQREWLGRWVIDLDALVYKFTEERNLYEELPGGLDWYAILSVDYGWHDKTAFGITLYSTNSTKVHIPHVEGHSEMIPSDAAGRLKQLIATWRPIKIVADTGGLGKTITEEMIRRHKIPMQAASKTDKRSWIELVNGDLRDGNLLIHRSLDELQHQLKTLVKNDKGLEDETLPNDLADVVLYGYREARGYASVPLAEKPKNKIEAERQKRDREERAIEEAEERALASREKLQWWER